MNKEMDREGEYAGSFFVLPIPEPLKSRKEAIPQKEKTSLFVPSELLFNGQVDFKPASFSNEVLVTRDVAGLLTAVFKHGDVAERYGTNGLETDPSRQQIAIYTLIVCQGNLLWYQRAEEGGETKVHGDTRLQGKFSIGFGGHKTREDISFSREDLTFLRSLLPAIQNEVGTILGLNRGFLAEVQEEIGLTRGQTLDLRLLGGIHDERIEDPGLDVQVGQVHTGIIGVLEVDPLMTTNLEFRTSEIARAWWVKFEDVEKELERSVKEGNKAESWTEIAIKEFWGEYLAISGN